MTNERILKLEVNQILDIYQYVDKIRPLLLNEKQMESKKLIISTGQGNSIHNACSRLLKRLRKENEDLKDFKQIRSSVISHWVKKYNLREVQYRSGHRYVSSTERYKQQDLKELQEELGKFHPF